MASSNMMIEVNIVVCVCAVVSKEHDIAINHGCLECVVPKVHAVLYIPYCLSSIACPDLFLE